jgi:hypothetical protein
MDDIKISGIDLSFDDNIHDLNDSLFGSFTDDYINYIYIALAFVTLLVIGFLLYKFYGNRTKGVTFQDNVDECYEDPDSS